MREICFFASFMVLVFLFESLAYAIPYLYNPVPENNSYVPGGPRTFYINITEGNLNTSSVVLYVKTPDEVLWRKFPMECQNSTVSDWICNATAPFEIVGSDTVELYYFSASDNLGNYGSNGTAENPLKLTVDKNPPEINFINPKNESWAGGTINITLDVTDVSSGVDDSTVVYSFDNSSWLKTTKTGYYIGEWNTSSLENGQNITIYAKATDKVGNTAYKKINVTIDNEIPVIVAVNPTQGQKITGNVLLEINVTELYSGIASSSFSVVNLVGTMDCVENVCKGYLDTRFMVDGEYTIVFTVSDVAGNKNSLSVNAIVDNTMPSIKINHPKNGSFVQEKFLFINATVINPGNIVQSLQLQIGKPGFLSPWMDMTEVGNHIYSYNLDTSQLSEGEYKIVVRAVNTLNYFINDSVFVVIDRTKPVLTLTSPDLYVKGIFYPRMIATDENGLNSTTAIFNVSGYSIPMSCTEQLQGKKLMCVGTFNSTLLTDGNHTLTLYIQDLAGNENSFGKTIIVDNNPPFLRYLKIDPIISEKPTKIKFYVDLIDTGSYVKNARVIVHLSSTEIEPVELNFFSNSSIGYGEKSIGVAGIHPIDIEATDLNDNTLYLSNIGFFYIGSLNCGNGICEQSENFCTCSNDCNPIECKSNEVIDCGSGIPKCMDATIVKKSLTYINTSSSGVVSKTELVERKFNFKVIIPATTLILAIILLVFMRRRKPKEEKPWYETISENNS